MNDFEEYKYVLSRLEPDGVYLNEELRAAKQFEAIAVIETMNDDRRIARDYILKMANFELPVLDHEKAYIEEGGIFIPFK